MSEITLREVASKITTYLRAFEADPEANYDTGYGKRYYAPSAVRSGARIRIAYKSYQHPGSPLTRAEAVAYLWWLDAGNVGTHRDWRSGTTR